MKEIKAIIFDLDGTIVDTLDDITVLCNTVLTQMGKRTFTSVEYRPWIGKGLHHLLISAVHNDEEQLEELWNNLFEIYKVNPVQESKIYTGIVDVLTFLQQQNLPVAVLSNKEEVLVKMIINILLPDFPFFMVRGFNDNFPAKPDPAQARHIGKKMNCSPENLAFIGDTLCDIDTAINAGMQSIAVSWGYGEPEDIAKADVVVSNPSELKLYLEEHIT